MAKKTGKQPQRKVRGRWVKQGHEYYAFCSGGGTHAIVSKNNMSFNQSKPWTCYSTHLEGPDFFATEKEAKRHIIKRLAAWLDNTESLRA